ncbi:hypothetical protein HA402_005539 [Bradysia odoriphaga]|nr:hypothetical protein HA402_005539 [Bradysia odoriphaga]
MTDSRTDASSENLSENNERKHQGIEFVNKAFELETTVITQHQTNEKNDHKKANDFMDFDDLLPHIGEFGRYQKILFLLMIPYAWFLVFVYFGQIFITIVPEQHWCNVPELQHLSIDERVELAIPLTNDGRSKCFMYAVNFTNILLQNETNKGDWPVKPCVHGWEYNRTEIPYATISSDLNWVCDNATLPTIAQSVFFVGAIVGGLIFGRIADRYGRVPSLMAANVVGAVGGIATAFTNDFWSFTICRFFVGFAFDNCFMIMYILVMEYVGPRYRTFIGNMSIALFFGTMACLIPWIAIYVGDWKLLSIYTSAPLLLVLLTPWVVPESARWLVSQDKIDRALKIIKRFERINGKSVDPAIYDIFIDSCAKIRLESASLKQFSVLDLFRKPRLRKITILLILFYMSISLVFDGYVRNIETMGLDTFVAFTIASATEMPSAIILTLILDRWGRRWLGLGTMVLCGLCSIIASFMPIGILTIVFIITGRFFVNFSYNIGMQYCAEILPTVVRAQGGGFIHIMGYVATILSPMIVYLGTINLALPLWILGILGLFGGSLALFLPETLGKTLPQTLDDGNTFGLDQKFLDIPCIRRETDVEEIQPPIPEKS